MDVRLRVRLDPALVAAVFGGVDGDDPRGVGVGGEGAASTGDEPVVAVDDVERGLVLERAARGDHVVVHVLDPGDELVEVARLGRLGDAVDGDAVLDGGLGERRVAAGEDVDIEAAAVERLGELADVPRENRLRRSAGTPR